MSHLLAEIARRLDVEAIATLVAARLPAFATALLIGLGFYLAWRVVSRGLTLFFKNVEFDRTGAEFIISITRFVLMIVGALTMLGQLGVNTASILTSLGVAGLTLGFAARDTLSNIISGLFIFWDRPFVLGDLVEIDGQYGRVEQITLRSTRLVTPDGRMIALANSGVVNAKLASYTNFPTLRLDVALTVGVEEDLGRVRRVLLEVTRERPGFLEVPSPEVVVTAINDYNVAVELRAWIKDEASHLSARFALREDAFEALRRERVVMPYQTITVETARVGAS